MMGRVMTTGRSAERLVFFSDAVVAIAITLLVLPLVDVVPDAARAGTPVMQLIANEGAQIFSFLLSFVVIARLWLAHHRLFAVVTDMSTGLILWNFGWLLTIVVLPFPTEVAGIYDRNQAVTLLYIGTVLASVVCQSAMALLIGRHRAAGAHDTAMVRGSLGSSAAIGAALLLTIVVPPVGFYSLLLLFVQPWITALVMRLRTRSASRA